MRAGTASNEDLKDLLGTWLAQLADDIARKHGLESAQFEAITHVQANLDDTVLSNLRLSD